MQNLIKRLATAIFTIFTIALCAGCADERYQSLERRQNGFDSRHDARMDRRQLRSDHADARFDRW